MFILFIILKNIKIVDSREKGRKCTISLTLAISITLARRNLVGKARKRPQCIHDCLFDDFGYNCYSTADIWADIHQFHPHIVQISFSLTEFFPRAFLTTLYTP